VNCGGVLKTLLEKRLITTAGRKPVIGRPILYRTSKDFLMRFGLSDLEELPSLKEFEQLAQAALGNDDGIAPIEPEDRAPEDRAEDAQAGTELAEGEAATEETAEGEAPKAAAAAAGAITSSATPGMATSGAETSSTTDSSIPESNTDSATPESSNSEEVISGADGD
jgi:segregation and condensation protein B